jgi:copper chaperone
MANDGVEAGATPESVLTGPSAEVELDVSGMHCQSCAALIEETLRDDPGVHGARVELDAARASVTFDSGTLSVDDLCAVVAGLGYRATPLSAGDGQR